MEEKRVIIKRGGTGSLLTGFLIGGLIGAAVALLSAPQSGSETRAMIGDKASDIKDRATNMASDAADRASKVVSSARDQASDVMNKAKDRVSDVASRGADKMQEGSKKARNMGDTISSSNPMG